MKPHFQAKWIQTLWRRNTKPKTPFLNDSWNNHNRLMLIPSHIKRENKALTLKSTYFLLTSRQWEKLSGNDSLMKSSSVLVWLVWVGVGGVGETMEETPSACCLICSFWRRRSFLKSLAFRHGGRLGSAPIPAPQKRKEGDGVPVRGSATKTSFLIYFCEKDTASHFQSISRWEYGRKKRQL